MVLMTGRILALDIGKKRMGIAISDPERIIAIPLRVTLRDRGETELENIAFLVQHYEVERVVVGLPLSLNGGVSQETQRVQEFVQWLSQRLSVPVDTWDERLSTVAAEKAMIECGVRREKRRAQRDAIAAALILQGYLDRLKAGGLSL